MTECKRCGWKYPDYMVQPMFYMNRYNDTCPICALAVKNAIHGTKETKFHGPMAEELRLEAVAHREENPEYGPKESK